MLRPRRASAVIASEAKQPVTTNGDGGNVDCFVASLLAMTSLLESDPS
jgi:hypothetical protein